MSENVKYPNRWVPVIASVFLQMVCGTAYIWSVFQTGVAKALFNGSNTKAALSFSILLAVLTVGSTIGGKLQDKYSPKYVLLGGGFIVAIGFFLASLATPAFPELIYIAYGVLGGFGMGAMYSTTIACCQKWFPDKRGFISGVIVSSLGMGSAIFTVIAAKVLLPALNGDVLLTFKYLAGIFLVMCTVASFFIKNPPQGYMPKGWTPPEPKGGLIHQQFSPMEMLKTKQFYIITCTLLLASIAGLMMINFATQIAMDKGITKDNAFWGAVVISLFNAFGRLTWGWLSDKLGRKNTIMLLSSATAVIVLFVNAVSGYYVFALIAAIGFLYGGFLGTFPALTADYFGNKNMGVNYGVVLLGFGIGAIIASYTAGYFKDIAIAAKDPSMMFPAFIIAACASVLGVVLIFLLKPPKAKG